MDGKRIVFDDLVRCVIDGDATGEEFQDLVEMMRKDPELQRWYCRQMHMHALLTCHKGQEWPEAEDLSAGPCCARASVYEAGKNEMNRGPGVTGRPTAGLWWKAAAAAAVLLGGVAVWRAADVKAASQALRAGDRAGAAANVPVVRLMSQKNLRGLDMPEVLPGLLRLKSGEVVVRLQTGVELTVLGPASVNIRSGIHVHLQSGKLLAQVPHWAIGFTVRTDELEIYDLGTLFGVQVNGNASEVFVFKGSVQVNEAESGEWGRESAGAGVGICEAGEGVRAVSGESPMKFAADFPEAKKLFSRVRETGAAMDTDLALKTAAEIADLFADRYMPGHAPAIKKAAKGSGCPFLKSAWVRPAAASQPRKRPVRGERTLMEVLSAAGGGASSEPVQVESSADNDNRRWSTVFTNEVSLKWDWLPSTARAKLEIIGMSETVATNFSAGTTEYLWRPFASQTPSAEDIFELRLSVCDGQSAAVSPLTARVVVLPGAFGKTVVDLRPLDKGLVFTQRNMVVPFDAQWAAATADAASSVLTITSSLHAEQTNRLGESSGFYGYRLNDFGYGTFKLALTFPETAGEWRSQVTWSSGGMVMSVR